MKAIISIPNILMLVPKEEERKKKKKKKRIQYMLTNYNIELENLTILQKCEHELSHFITSTSLLYDDSPVQSLLVQLY